MANNPCPKCGAVKWWWRDETGCSKCVDETKSPPGAEIKYLSVAEYAALLAEVQEKS